MRLIRQWAIGGALSMGALAWLFFDSYDAVSHGVRTVSTETDYTLWTAAAFAAAAIAMLLVAIRPTSRAALDTALACSMGACLLRGWELALVDSQPGSTRWLGPVVYASFAAVIGVCGLLLRRIQRPTC